MYKHDSIPIFLDFKTSIEDVVGQLYPPEISRNIKFLCEMMESGAQFIISPSLLDGKVISLSIIPDYRGQAKTNEVKNESI
jgi:hypothetical protein